MVNKFIFSTKREAQEVVKCMREMIDTYGVVTVADYYDLCGMHSSYTDEKYGWITLRPVKIEKSDRYGFNEWTIELPKPLEIV